MQGDLERDLVARCRVGDRSAYTDLVRSCSARVFAICLAMLGNRHDAEDVAQQTLLKGLTAISGLRRDDQFGAWISRIARNLCIDLIRKCRHKPNILARQADPSRAEPRDYGELQVALAKLPEDLRLTLMLYYFDGRSTQNIAESLDISQGAVQTRLCRARRRLRTLLEAQRGA